jgi:glutamyl-Q tRNA(Asp) synthetase
MTEVQLAQPARYRGRFAPSPTGPLHAGSLVAALASWLDAKAYQGEWLIRIEDVDTPRCNPEHAHHILRQLDGCGLHSDAPVVWQSTRSAHYQAALDDLLARGLAYGCACTRQDVAQHWSVQGRRFARHEEVPYPGTCRTGTGERTPRAVRLNTQGAGQLTWTDARLGMQQQDLEHEVGDFVLRRGDGLWAYQLAVVVDDAEQRVTHVVRGEDLANNTARQIWLQRALALPRPQYQHTPLVMGDNGEKLSKQNSAAPVDTSTPGAALQALERAAQHLGLPGASGLGIADALAQWVQAWAAHKQSTSQLHRAQSISP